jgi:integrase
VPCEDVAAARGRAVGLASCVVRWLKKGEPMPWIFPSPGGTAFEERNVRTVFARLLAKADIRQICIHDLRHPYSTLLLQTGAPITYVSQQPGHRDASITLGSTLIGCPAVSRRVDRLDPLQPDATPAQPEAVPTTNRPSVSRLF